MAKPFESIRKIFAPIQPRQPGIYHYISPPDNPLNYRFHLRIEEGGTGILLVNASTILHLNETAVEHAYHLVHGRAPEQAAKKIAGRYKIAKSEALHDFLDFKNRIEALITTPDLDPVTFLDFDRHTPYEDIHVAPYRLDCAITYQLPEGSPLDSAPTKRVDRELTTEEWKTIIDKAWQAGIPHILFTGGEPTMREDLVELIAHAENNGQVTGLITDGLKLGDTTYLNALLQAGLDHTMIVLQPEDDKTWDALASFSYWTKTLDEDIFVAAHLTLTKENADGFNALIDKLAQTDISALSLSENDRSLSEQLQLARDYANEQNIELVWDLPVPYSKLNPVALELETGEDQVIPQGIGKAWLYLEPDGDILPTQGINYVLGSMLNDPWDKIWQAAKDFSKG